MHVSTHKIAPLTRFKWGKNWYKQVVCNMNNGPNFNHKFLNKNKRWCKICKISSHDLHYCRKHFAKSVNDCNQYLNHDKHSFVFKISVRNVDDKIMVLKLNECSLLIMGLLLKLYVIKISLLILIKILIRPRIIKSLQIIAVLTTWM